jgi:CBS domain containing-hemolysin-like protein
VDDAGAECRLPGRRRPAGAFGGWRPVGLLSDRDIVTNVFARDCNPRNVVVEEVMARHPLTVFQSASVDDTLQRMRAAGTRRVPAVDDRGCLTGILALEDIYEHLVQRVPSAVTPIRPDLRTDARRTPAQPGNMGIERI